MAGLDDYLSELSSRPLRGFGSTPVLPSGVISPIVQTPPRVVTASPAAVAQAANLVASTILPIFQATDQAAVDAAMWTLDLGWLSASQWRSMKSCVKVGAHVTGIDSVATDVTSSPWTTQAACKTNVGADIPPVCRWGYWQINKCSLDVASKMIFQYPRYLWAQQRMREHLALKPQRGVTPPDVAAEWVWRGAQLLSAYFWSTNVRFNNDEGSINATTGPAAYAKWTPPFAGGGQGGFGWNLFGNLTTQGGVAEGSRDADFPYDGVPTPNARMYQAFALHPRIWNMLQNPPLSDSVVDPFGFATRPAPQSQNDFSPGDGLFRWLLSGSGVAPPYGLTPAQVSEVRALIPPATDASGFRWGPTKAFLLWWFRATWNWPTMWQYAGETTVPAGPLTGPARQYSVVVGGAAQSVEYMSSWLAAFSDPAKKITDWMQFAFNQWDLDTAGVGNQSTVAVDFVHAKQSVRDSLATAAAAQAQASLSAPPGTPDQNLAVATIQTVMAAIMAVVTSVFPLAGILLSAANVISQLIDNLVIAAVGPAVGNIPCAALPFIRVMSPPTGPCDLTLTSISSALLGIDSRANWPVSISGQTRIFAIDGKVFTTVFTETDTTADLVARRINAAAALVGLGIVASVQNGQVHVEGRDGSTPAQATGGTAAALGFPGPLTGQATPPPTQPPSQPTPPPPAPKSAVPTLVAGGIGLALLAKILGGAAKASSVASAVRKR